MKQYELTRLLAAARLESYLLSMPGGGSILVTPHGARVLGVFTHADADNPYYVNPELAAPETATRFLAHEHILGGDRLWIAPQLGIFFTGHTIDSQVVPPSIDPGSYRIDQQSSNSISLTNQIKTPFFHLPGTGIQASVARTIRIIPSPLADDPAQRYGSIRYVGYEIATRFELQQAPCKDMFIGLWFLVQIAVTQLGGAGHLFVPTLGRATVTHYFDRVSPDYLRIAGNHVRFRLDAARQYKIGICKTDVTRRAAFLSNADARGESVLMIRNFPINPSGYYADIPLSQATSSQDAIQSYNDLAGPGGLGELEHHTPAVCLASDEPIISECNQMWIFSGPRSMLIDVAARLLGLPPDIFAA